MSKILFVEDDHYFSAKCMAAFQDAGLAVEHVKNASSGLDSFTQDPAAFAAVVLDIAMPAGDHFSEMETRGGFEAGLALGRSILRTKHDVKLIGITAFPNEEVIGWFRDRKFDLLEKSDRTPSELTKRLLRNPGTTPFQFEKCFIVHGHDLEEVEALKAFLKENVKDLRPIVLSENRSGGLTIIEKFEEYAKESFVVFALMTPDDIVVNLKKDEITRRARQNVIFEVGYFLGAMGRKTGKVLLLCKGNVEIPSDLDGVVRISITNGIASAHKEILGELGL
jgi:predicted nucleotide-binding protein